MNLLGKKIYRFYWCLDTEWFGGNNTGNCIRKLSLRLCGFYFLCILELLSSIPLGILQICRTNNLHKEGTICSLVLGLPRILLLFINPSVPDTSALWPLSYLLVMLLISYRNGSNWRTSSWPCHSVHPMLWYHGFFLSAPEGWLSVLPRATPALVPWICFPCLEGTALAFLLFLSQVTHGFLSNGCFPSAHKHAVISSFLKKRVKQ